MDITKQLKLFGRVSREDENELKNARQNGHSTKTVDSYDATTTKDDWNVLFQKNEHHTRKIAGAYPVLPNMRAWLMLLL